LAWKIMNVLSVPRLVYSGYFVHVPAVYLQCTSPVHHPLPPVEGPRGDSLHLEQEWHRVPCDAGLLLDRFLETARLNLLDLLDGLLEFGRFVPNVGPVTVTNTRGKTGTNGVEHVLRRIDVVGANSSMTSKVLSNGSRVLTDITKVDLQK